jgi:hypothetical protein
MCQDTGTAIVMGKKSEGMLTGADDAEWISKGGQAALRGRPGRRTWVTGFPASRRTPPLYSPVLPVGRRRCVDHEAMALGEYRNGSEVHLQAVLGPHSADRFRVERTFAWLGRYRWLSKDYEYRTETSEAMIYAAMTQLMARRLARW